VKRDQEERKPYVFLHERAETWLLRFEVARAVVVLAFVLFLAFSWAGGFWSGLWYVIWHTS
jgi:fatty acid desaturase